MNPLATPTTQQNVQATEAALKLSSNPSFTFLQTGLPTGGISFPGGESSLSLQVASKLMSEDSVKNMIMADPYLKKSVDIWEKASEQAVNGDRTKFDRLIQLYSHPFVNIKICIQLK